MYEVFQSSIFFTSIEHGMRNTSYKVSWFYSLVTPVAVAPTNNNVVKVMKIVLEDTDEQQKQNVSIKDPKEKLIRFDIVNHIEF